MDGGGGGADNRQTGAGTTAANEPKVCVPRTIAAGCQLPGRRRRWHRSILEDAAAASRFTRWLWWCLWLWWWWRMRTGARVGGHPLSLLAARCPLLHLLTLFLLLLPPLHSSTGPWLHRTNRYPGSSIPGHPHPRGCPKRPFERH